MEIVFKEETKTFHLYNDQISYIIQVLPNAQMGQLYFGKRVHDREDFSYLLETLPRPMASCVFEDDKSFSLDHILQEYPSYGTGDYKSPAVEVLQKTGSRITSFIYKGHKITSGKPRLEGLPATYTEDEKEAATLTIYLEDEPTGLALALFYTIFADRNAIARSARFVNEGGEELMHIGLVTSDATSGEIPGGEGLGDFESRIFLLKARTQEA